MSRLVIVVESALDPTLTDPEVVAEDIVEVWNEDLRHSDSGSSVERVVLVRAVWED